RWRVAAGRLEPIRARRLTDSDQSYLSDTCSGLPLRRVEASSSSCFSLIEACIDFDAPLSSLTLLSPRLAESAAPAAFCCAFDLAGMMASFAGRLRGTPDASVGSVTKPGRAAHH